MTHKELFASQCQAVSTSIAQACQLAEDLNATYFDRGYNTGGTAIVDGDLTALGITAANISSFITLAQQLLNFRDNASVSTADYGSTLNSMRTDI